ncbi:DNA-binding response regulator [Flavobacteriaceae bacterium (ex Bugula neritina AB1)]|nr:DNA-binding response regulator [Flavobacteriaceae bacterium (ex Bugula neritina AB1)]
MKCIIVDDEPLAIDLLVNYLERLDSVDIGARFNNPIEAITYIQKNSVDLVFLDIEMPNLTGLEFVKTIPKLPQFIFTTAYPKYALEGFELDATDYLVKPIPFPRFVKAVSKAKEKHNLLTKTSSSPNPTNEDDFIFVKSEYENIKIKTQDIIYIEGLKDYIKIYVKSNAKSVLTLMSFKAILDKLRSSNFIRIHRSYIVNIDFITAHQKNKLIINNQRIPIGDTYKKEVLRKLGIE